jgi:hypothetical protein
MIEGTKTIKLVAPQPSSEHAQYSNVHQTRTTATIYNAEHAGEVNVRAY